MEACLGFDLTNLLPTTGLTRIEDCFANVLSLQGIAEVGSEGTLLPGAISLDKIGELVDEAMLVTDVQSGHPPLVHIGVFSSVVGDMDGSPATGLGVFLVVLEVFETVKVMQVPEERTIGTVDLEGIKCLVTSGITGGFEYCQGTVGELGQKGAGIINGYLLFLSCLGVHAFLDECFGHGADFHDRAIQPDCGVDAMGE